MEGDFLKLKRLLFDHLQAKGTRHATQYLPAAESGRVSTTRRLAPRGLRRLMLFPGQLAVNRKSTTHASHTTACCLADLPSTYGWHGYLENVVLRVMNWSAVHWMRMHGVTLGEKPWILGFPDLKLARESRIVIGNSVSLFSSRWANPLRPQRRLSLITLQAGASIIIGNGVGITSSVISCATSISIGDRTLIGSDCLIVDTDFHGIPAAQLEFTSNQAGKNRAGCLYWNKVSHSKRGRDRGRSGHWGGKCSNEKRPF